MLLALLAVYSLHITIHPNLERSEFIICMPNTSHIPIVPMRVPACLRTCACALSKHV